MVTEMECTKCGKTKELKFFNKDKKGKYGFSAICKECRKIYRRKHKNETDEYNKQYRIDHSKEISESGKRYRKNHVDAVNVYNKEYKSTHKEESREYGKEYYEEHKSEINEKARISQEKRRKNDPLFKFKVNIKGLVYIAFKNKGYKKGTKTADILGPWHVVEPYFESQFDKHMTWGNHGTYWEIDHINPLKDAHTYDDVVKWNHYTNLRPLKKKDNRDKGGNKPDEDYQLRLM